MHMIYNKTSLHEILNDTSVCLRIYLCCNFENTQMAHCVHVYISVHQTLSCFYDETRRVSFWWQVNTQAHCIHIHYNIHVTYPAICVLI